MQMKRPGKSIAHAYIVGLVLFGCTCAMAQQVDRCVAFPEDCEWQSQEEAYEQEIRLLLDQLRNRQAQTDPDDPPPNGCDNPPFRQPGEPAQSYLERLNAWLEECSESNTDDESNPTGDDGTGESDPEIEIDAVDADPVAFEEYSPIVSVAPEYPARALSREIEGHVYLKFTVTSTGTVRDPVVIQSTSSLFERAAIRAVLQYKYIPRAVDGAPVDTPNVRTRVAFEIEQ